MEAWLKQFDNVFNVSGEPTVASLTDALKKINKADLAKRIIRGNLCYNLCYLLIYIAIMVCRLLKI